LYGNPQGAPATDQRGVIRLHDIEGHLMMDIGAVAASVPVGSVATHLKVTAQPATVSPNGTVHLHVTALDQFNNLVPTYRGRVKVTSSDPQAVLPAPVDFGTSPYAGAADIDVVLRTTGSQSIWVSDPASFTVAPSVRVTLAPPTVATRLRATLAGSIVYRNVPFSITVSATDDYNNLVRGYTGTVHLDEYDLGGLSRSYTYTAADQGTHTFAGLTLHALGSHSIYYHDSAIRLESQDVDVYQDITAVNGEGITSTISGVSSDPFRGTASAQVTLTNNSHSFAGSVLSVDAVVLKDLSLGLRLTSAAVIVGGRSVRLNIEATTNGELAFRIPSAVVNNTLHPGDSLHLSLGFANPFDVAVYFTVRSLSSLFTG
jgi:hypothetical protein